MRLSKSLLVGDVAKRTGVPISTIHFYEKKGLITSTRDSSNHRHFNRDVLRVISVIRIAQESGISLADIKAALQKLPDNRKVTEDDWSVLSMHWRKKLNERINSLMTLRDNLDSCIGCGCLSLTKCQLFNADDIAGESGPGALIFR
jgi:MerR family redox-sensitive transcriptional activator SoxR